MTPARLSLANGNSTHVRIEKLLKETFLTGSKVLWGLVPVKAF
jgi:hypothetical protein